MPSYTKDTESVEVAVIGGGIVGLVLAAGLTRRQIKVKVYEQSQGFRDIGAGIGFNGAAKACMQMIDPGVITALHRGGGVAVSAADEDDPHDYLRWIDGFDRGNVQHLPDQKLYCKVDAGYKSIEGTRRDRFLEELAKDLPEGIVEFKKRLRQVEEGGDDCKLQLHFEDGTIVEADAVVGCDGIKSRVREIVLSEASVASNPSYTHVNFYSSMIPMNKAVDLLGKFRASVFHNHIGPGANVLHYPVANGTLCNVSAFVHDANEWPADKPPTSIGFRKDIQEKLVGWSPVVRGLIDLFPDTLPVWAVFDLWEHPMPYYNRGRICVAGDAAHASSPHHGAGAGMGIEDALCLSVLLDEVSSSIRLEAASRRDAISVAFQVYDSIRRRRSQWLVNSSRRLCDLQQHQDWADPAKLVKAETCFEEITDRTYKIWNFDFNGMVKESIEKYGRAINILRRNGLATNTECKGNGNMNGARA